MADFTAAIRTLERQRDELLAQRDDLFRQLDAINRAISALTGSDKGVRVGPVPRVEAASPAPPPKPIRKKRQFTLSEEHKRKLLEGQRRAREARGAATQASDAGAPIIAAWHGDGPPRLVKRDGETPEQRPVETIQS
jgi:hypothetical protein